MSGTMTKKTNSKQLLILLAVIEVIFITLFGFFVRYDEQWSDADTTRYRFTYSEGKNEFSVYFSTKSPDFSSGKHVQVVSEELVSASPTFQS